MSEERLKTVKVMEAQLLAKKLERVLDWVRYIQQMAEIYEKVKVFEAVVWFPRIQRVILAEQGRGMSALFRDIKIMVWSCAGRCLVQLERNGHRITLITADDEKPWQRDNSHVAPGMGPMGIQSIDGEYLEILKMLYEATRYYQEIILTSNENVSIA